LGRRIDSGDATLDELESAADAMGACTPFSGRQEMLEAMVNDVMYAAT
jgi:xylose isomerase